MPRNARALRAVLFDWDGTLLDSADASFRCYQRLFTPFGIDFTQEVFARTYAPDWYRTYEGIGLPRERWPEADARWLEFYAEESCALRPGTVEALARIGSAGVLTGLVTSGSRARVETELSRLGIAAAFSTVVCGEDAKQKKPNPEALRTALTWLRISAAEAAYIGDSPEDIEMARAAGVFAVGLEGGFPNAQALKRSEPDAIAGDLKEAVDIVLARSEQRG